MRKEFWENKIAGTVVRDQRNLSDLTEQGWRIAVVWECVTKKADDLKSIIEELSEWIIHGQSKRIELPDQNT